MRLLDLSKICRLPRSAKRYLLPIAYCLLPIAYCLLPMPGWMHSAAWMHTASECILPLNAFGRRMHSAAGCIRRPMHSAARPGWLPPGPGPLCGAPPPRPRGPPPRGGRRMHRPPNAFGGRMHSAAECIQRQYAFGGSMHSEAVCIQARMQSISLLPIAYHTKFRTFRFFVFF